MAKLNQKKSIRLDGYDSFENPFNAAVRGRLSHIMKNGVLVPLQEESDCEESSDSENPAEKIS